MCSNCSVRLFFRSCGVVLSDLSNHLKQQRKNVQTNQVPLLFEGGFVAFGRLVLVLFSI